MNPQHRSRLLAMGLALLVGSSLFVGCSEKSVSPKTEMSEKDVQQIKEYQQQATDEWGNKKSK